jgi:hypothetical protein
MRALLVATVALAGCGSDGSGTCMTDSQCGGDVCARDGECLPASEIQSVKVTWTIRGQAASAMTCAASPSFLLQFDGYSYGDSFGYAPVPCMEGQFTMDKLPTRFVQVDVGLDNAGSFLGSKPIDASGVVAFDLAP